MLWEMTDEISPTYPFIALRREATISKLCKSVIEYTDKNNILRVYYGKKWLLSEEEKN